MLPSNCYKTSTKETKVNASGKHADDEYITIETIPFRVEADWPTVTHLRTFQFAPGLIPWLLLYYTEPLTVLQGDYETLFNY